MTIEGGGGGVDGGEERCKLRNVEGAPEGNIEENGEKGTDPGGGRSPRNGSDTHSGGPTFFILIVDDTSVGEDDDRHERSCSDIGKECQTEVGRKEGGVYYDTEGQRIGEVMSEQLGREFSW